MKNILMAILIFIMSLIGLEETMAVQFTAAGQGIMFNKSFNMPGGITMMAWCYVDGWYPPNDTSKTMMHIANSSETGVYSINVDPYNANFSFLSYNSPNLGFWEFAITTGQWVHVAVTYDPYHTNIDPIAYVNGSPKAVTETVTPSGSHAITPTKIYVGNPYAAFNGKIADERVYNRILTAAEIYEIHAMKALKSNETGLVFHPNMLRAEGLTAFDGALLGATTYFYDEVGGEKGVVSGSPTGMSDTILN